MLLFPFPGETLEHETEHWGRVIPVLSQWCPEKRKENFTFWPSKIENGEPGFDCHQSSVWSWNIEFGWNVRTASANQVSTLGDFFQHDQTKDLCLFPVVYCPFVSFQRALCTALSYWCDKKGGFFCKCPCRHFEFCFSELCHGTSVPTDC